MGSQIRVISLILIGAIFCFAEVSLAQRLAPLPESLQEAFLYLSQQKANYKAEGVVCEQLAKREFTKQYSKADYYIDVGVEYQDSQGQTIGELDLVVYDLRRKMIELLVEVKCWRSLDQGMDKAQFQRDRFLYALQTQQQNLVFVSKNPHQQYSHLSFSEVLNYRFASQVGGKKWGFDLEIPFTLSDIELLQQHLVRCQKKGLCHVSDF